MTVDTSGLLPLPTGKPKMIQAGVKTASYTLKAWELALFDATSSSMTATLPASAPVGTEVVVKRIDLANTDPTNANTVSIVPSSGETLRNGLTTSASLPLSGQDQARLLVKESATQWTAIVDDPLPSLYPRFPRLLYSMSTIKAGDTIQASTTTAEQTFASTYTFPANSMTVGQKITLTGWGLFTSTGLGPTQRPRVRLGSTLLIDAGVKMLLAGVTGYIYRFDCTFVVRSTGATGSIDAFGELEFQSGADGTFAVFGHGPVAGGGQGGPVSLNTTVANTLALSTQYATATAGNSNQLKTFDVMSSLAPNGSN